MKRTNTKSTKGLRRAASLLAASASLAALGTAAATSSAQAATVSAWSNPGSATFVTNQYGSNVMLEARLVDGAPNKDFVLSAGGLQVAPTGDAGAQKVQVTYRLQELSDPKAGPGATWSNVSQGEVREVSLADGTGQNAARTVAGPTFQLRKQLGTPARFYRVKVNVNWLTSSGTYLAGSEITPSLTSEVRCGDGTTRRVNCLAASLNGYTGVAIG